MFVVAVECVLFAKVGAIGHFLFKEAASFGKGLERSASLFGCHCHFRFSFAVVFPLDVYKFTAYLYTCQQKNEADERKFLSRLFLIT